ncbi:AraC family transcriptional regulator [Nocardia sp. JCM 34519.1]|uniref:AraC family transcriptional regulator n=1 Tax=unclassified Nocardia TaxID=2637762 RepID=UPI001CE48805
MCGGCGPDQDRRHHDRTYRSQPVCFGSAIRRARFGSAIAVVARQNGFRDPSHFSRRFSSTFGMTPRE